MRSPRSHVVAQCLTTARSQCLTTARCTQCTGPTTSKYICGDQRSLRHMHILHTSPPREARARTEETRSRPQVPWTIRRPPAGRAPCSGAKLPRGARPCLRAQPPASRLRFPRPRPQATNLQRAFPASHGQRTEPFPAGRRTRHLQRPTDLSPARARELPGPSAGVARALRRGAENRGGLERGWRARTSRSKR